MPRQVPGRPGALRNARHDVTARRTVVPVTPDLGDVRALVARESGLAVAVVYRSNGSAVASVVNAGVVDHPTSGDPVVAFVLRGHARKIQRLRADPRATVVFRAGWDWAAVEGTVDLVGPDDPFDGVAMEDLPRLLRSVYAAAVGGSPDEWAALDSQMEAEGHTAALLSPLRIYASPPETSP